MLLAYVRQHTAASPLSENHLIMGPSKYLIELTEPAHPNPNLTLGPVRYFDRTFG